MTRVPIILSFVFPMLCRAGTFVVTNTLGMGDGSFRWAVQQVNEHTGADTILFAIPERDPGHDPARGVWTIAMGGEIQNCMSYNLSHRGTFVDGFSQRRFVGGDPNPFGPEIELRPPPSGFSGDKTGISVYSDSIQIRGLCVNAFESSAIIIHGWPPGEEATDVVVAGCYLGLDPTGSAVEEVCGYGIHLYRAVRVRIGGDAPEEHNVVVGGTNIDMAWCGDIAIVNNYLGTDRTGTTCLYGGLGLFIGRPTGPMVIRDNLIAAHIAENVWVNLSASEGAVIEFLGNRIGVGLDGSPMGGIRGIDIAHSPGHLIRGNTLGYVHDWWGIYLHGDDTDYVTISRNSIYGCHRLGINLCQEAYQVEAGNAVDYVDGQYGPGPNEEIDPCLCDSVRNVSDGQGGTTTAYFTCMKECTVEVFVGDTEGSNLACSMGPSYGRVYSGRTYLGDAEEVEPGPVFSTYRFSVSPGLSVGTRLTATATNQNGSTSEFGCSGVVPYPGQTAEGCSATGYAFTVDGPNPGVGDFVLRYRLPERQRVRIMAYTMAGELAARVADEVTEAGEHTLRWEARDARGMPLPSGAYVLRLATDRSVLSAKAVVLR